MSTPIPKTPTFTDISLLVRRASVLCTHHPTDNTLYFVAVKAFFITTMVMEYAITSVTSTIEEDWIIVTHEDAVE